MLTLKCVLVGLILDVALGASMTSAGSNVREKRQRSYGDTIIDIGRSLKKLESKLARHEYREAQLGDFTMKTLNSLNSGQSTTKKDIQVVSKQLANMEEKMFAIEALISTTDERQRHLLKALGQGINRLITMSRGNDLLPPPDFNNPGLSLNGDGVASLVRKIDALDDATQNDIKILNNEVKIVGEALDNRMDRLTSLFDGHLMGDYNKCNKEHIEPLSIAVSDLTRRNTQLIDEVKSKMTASSSSGGCEVGVREIAQKLDSLDAFQRQKTKEMTSVEMETQKALVSQKRDLRDLLDANQAERQLVEESIQGVVHNLQEFERASQKQLGILETNIENVLEQSADKMKAGINDISSTLKLKSSNIMDALEDSASQNNNMQETMRDNFVDMTKEIRGLKRVEQVMISTADAVLDTKRSIEFGIQQVIIELSDIVRNSGRNINTTLTEKINDISFAILRNQTTALTNMTAKMELEISQVWRQIGVMYQQMLQSVHILDDLQSSTSQQMNQSLNKVDHMDGTVGKINSKVAGVEDDLNYLLGRLTLVVSEFSQLKSGVGDELDRLRDMAKEFSNEAVVEYSVHDQESNSDEEEVPPS